MKLVYFGDFRLGVLKGDAVVDVSAAVKDIPHSGPGDLMNGLIEHWDSYKARLETAAASGAGVPVSGVRIRPPVPAPRTIDCMAVNYMEDGTRSAPAPINAFHKSPSAIIGHGDTMVLPDVPATCLRRRGRARGRHRQEVHQCQRSRGHGLRLRLHELHRWFGAGPAAARQRVLPDEIRDTFAPIGPYLVTADEIKDPLKLQIRLWNNGVLMQDFNTDDMGHKIAQCIAWLSSIHTLLPGDIVATGTNHRGLNPFMDGDTIELETEGLGRLKFGIKDDLKRSWARKTRLRMHEEAKERTPGLYPDLTPQLSGKYAK